MLLSFLSTSRFFHCFPLLGIFLVLGGNSCTCNQINITRVNDSLDVFSTLQTNCNAFCSVKNSLFLRSSSSSCVCRCSPRASTFVFKGDLISSTCVDNFNIRSTIGQCQLFLDGNNITSPVPVLDLSLPGSRVLTGPVNSSSACGVVQEEFLENGTWLARAGGNLTNFKTEKNLLKWSSVLSSPYAGRVVRVQLQCDINKFCIVIKIQGHISYIVPAPVSSTSMSLRPSPTTSYIKPAHHTPSTSHHTRSKTKNIIPLKPATISPTLTTVVMVTSSAVVIPKGGPKAVQDGCERGAWIFCQRFYLAMAAVGIVVLIVIVIILISCACVRRRRRNLRHQKPVYFKSGLTTLKETDSSTELALIEDAKPASEGHKGQNSEEAFYQNVPRREKPVDKNELYRPLRSSDGRDSPTTPVSPGRFSSSSSTNEVILYDDTTDSKHLIKPEQTSQPSQPSAPAGKRLRTFCPSPVVQFRKEFLSNQTVLDGEEEATYEIMDTKTLPHSGRKRGNIESITGFENQVFEEDDHRQSYYEAVADEQPDYENLGGDYQVDQLKTMEEHENGVRIEGKNYTDLGDEQETYETMDTFSGEEQLDYEIMPDQDEKLNFGDQEPSLLYEKMGSHNKICHPNASEKEDMEDEREYDIPVITQDGHDSHYDIPELSLEVQQESDEPDYHYAVNTGDQNTCTGLKVPSEIKHKDGGDYDDYVYANVPEIQANNLREKLRNSLHSGEQQREDEARRESKTMAEKPRTEKRPSSWNTNDAGKISDKTAHEEDDEELYSLPEDFPKPLPSCLSKGRSSPQIKRAEAKNQASPKQKPRSDKSNGPRQANEQMNPKDSDVVPNRAQGGSPKTSKPGAKTNVPVTNTIKKDRSSLEQPGNSSVVKGRDIMKDRPEHLGKEGKTSSKENSHNTTSRLDKSEGGASSPSQTRSASKEKQERRRRQPNSGKKQASVEPQKNEEHNQGTRWNQEGHQSKKTDDQVIQGKQPEGLINEQPLYTNLVEMENERQTLANEKTDVQTNQQPLYENLR